MPLALHHCPVYSGVISREKEPAMDTTTTTPVYTTCWGTHEGYRCTEQVRRDPDSGRNVGEDGKPHTCRGAR
jgi:hypothetical protein